jgi:hypothetical protein
MVLFRATFGLPSPVSPLGEGPRARRPHTCPGSEAHREAAIAHPEPTRAQDSSPPGRGSEGPYTATPAMEKPT